MNPDTLSAAKALDWLGANPVEYQAIVALWDADHGGDPTLIPFMPEGETLAAQHVAYVERYLQSGMFGACALCFHPVITFGDLRSFDWPTLGEHDCALRMPPEPKSATPAGMAHLENRGNLRRSQRPASVARAAR